jgi:hypothetical protein
MENKPFSTYTVKKYISEDDIMQLRQWKNILVERKGSVNRESELHTFYSDELIRVVDFLNTLTVEKFD